VTYFFAEKHVVSLFLTELKNIRESGFFASRVRVRPPEAVLSAAKRLKLLVNFSRTAFVFGLLLVSGAVVAAPPQPSAMQFRCNGRDEFYLVDVEFSLELNSKRFGLITFTKIDGQVVYGTQPVNPFGTCQKLDDLRGYDYKTTAELKKSPYQFLYVSARSLCGNDINFDIQGTCTYIQP
jgi:hypothetical protein